MDRQSQVGPAALAEGVVRLIAGAASASRLYPPTSAMRVQAVQRLVEYVGESTARLGPIQLRVDRERFWYEGQPVGVNMTQVAALAELLHALQVGQLIVAPELSLTEVEAFLEILNAEPRAVRQSGGIRNALVQASVKHIAVVEVTLRASTEEGLMGLDLTAAPIEDIVAEIPGVADKWVHTSAEGEGTDDVAAAIDRLEDAAQQLAADRVAQALLRLDEETRSQILASAFREDTRGECMEGMLRVIARMNPSALARLLKLAASSANASPNDMLAKIELPPEVMKEIAMLFAPSPKSEEACGVPTDPDVPGMSQEMAVEDEGETARLEAEVAGSAPARAAGRALITTVDVSHARPNEESVRAIGEALLPAIRVKAFREVSTALDRLEQLETDPALATETARAKATLADTETLASACLEIANPEEASALIQIMRMAGPAGPETVMSCYVTAEDAVATLLREALARVPELVGPIAGRYLRGAEPAGAVRVLQLIASLHDRRFASVVASGLDHPDAAVRIEAVRTLAIFGDDESAELLGKALRDPQRDTRAAAIAALCDVLHAHATVHIAQVLGRAYAAERDSGLKAEVIRCLGALDPSIAVPVLEPIAKRKFAFGRKNRELRSLAEATLARLSGK